MTRLTWRPVGISTGAFIGYAIAYLVITATVAAILYGSYVFEVPFMKVPPVVFVLAGAVLAYIVQHRLSAATGLGRFADLIVSFSMLVVVGVYIAYWSGIPIVHHVADLALTVVKSFGITIVETTTEYKNAVALFFGIAAGMDVFFRDILGIGRRSSRFYGTGGETPDYRRLNRDDLFAEPGSEFPDRTEDLGSRSGKPLLRTEGDAIIELRWWIRDPFTGELLPVRSAPPRLAVRAIEHLSGERIGPTRRADAPADGGGSDAPA